MIPSSEHYHVPRGGSRGRRLSFRLTTRRLAWWVVAVLAAGTLLVARANFGLYFVVGESMTPGLRSGDLLIVNRRAYRTAAPERGDVVVARTASDLIVKRVVGLPGETIELRQGQLYINGTPRTETYPVQPGWLSLGSGRLFDGRYALLGDNRALPVSVSVHAVVAGEQVLGKAVQAFRLWPVRSLTEVGWDQHDGV